MTTGGWIFMTVSLALVWGVTIWSYWKMVTAPPEPAPPKPPHASS